jgi:beta-lactamase superfamily II metal-dependent hydrolase
MMMFPLLTRRHCSQLALALVALSSPLVTGAAESVGQPLSRWTPGTLDIHHINTGQGDSALLIYPDGTTHLIDVGDGRNIVRPPGYKSPSTPDDSRPPGEWVARYAHHWHPKGADGILDYVHLTHFDVDHIGGFADLAKHIGIRTLVDRAFPDYGSPNLIRDRMQPAVARFRNEVENLRKTKGLLVERFVVGRNDQFIQRHLPSQGPGFEIRNLAVNGTVWTGQGTETSSRFPSTDLPAENPCSTVFRLTYGPFSYYNGGDLVGQLKPTEAAWRDVESAVAWHVGQVDVHVADHHGYSDSANAYFLSVLQPRIHIIQAWSAAHPFPDVLDRMLSEKIYPGPREVFSTNALWDGRREHIDKLFGPEAGAKYAEGITKFAGNQGHIVIRVQPGGDSYQIYMLEDTSEKYRIRSVHGPYSSR